MTDLPTTRSPTLPLEISPANLADIPSLAALHVSAFKPDLCVGLMIPTDAEHHSQVTAMCTSHIPNPKALVTKATLAGTDEIVGWAMWLLFDGTEKWEESRQIHAEAGEEQKIAWAGVGEGEKALAEVIAEKSAEVQREWMGGKKYMLLNSLITSPSKQRQGIGSALLRSGTDRADQEAIPCYLQSSPVARKLYLEHGWKEVAASEVDLSRWAGDDRGWGVYRFKYMLRLPVPVKEEV